MRFKDFSFGSIRIDGVTHEHDVVMDRGEIHKRKKKPSKKVSRPVRAHAPVGRGRYTLEMPAARDQYWGTWSIAGDEGGEARSQAPEIKLLILPTSQAIEELEKSTDETNAVLHVTC